MCICENVCVFVSMGVYLKLCAYFYVLLLSTLQFSGGSCV